MMKKKPAALLVFFGLLLSLSYASAGTVLSSYKYAWSDNVGYINFENVVVGDSTLSGYAWSENAGWIKFNPSRGGVLNNGSGNLSGFAWGEQLGWIDFDGVTINTDTGRFSGTAVGSLVGTINFNCPTYCDVRTDWRMASPPASPPAGGGAVILLPNVTPAPGVTPTPQTPTVPSSTLPPGTPDHVETHNEPLAILPEQSGTFTQDTPIGQVVIEVPARNLSSHKRAVFIITEEPLVPENQYLISLNTELVNNAFYDISANDQDGNPIDSFPNPITVTLPVPKNLQNTTGLGVYWLNEVNSQWVLVPDADFSYDKAIFQVNSLTKFAIFKMTGDVKNATLPFSGKSVKQVIPQSLKISNIPPKNNPLTSICSIPESGIRSLRNVVIFSLAVFLTVLLILLKNRRRRKNTNQMR